LVLESDPEYNQPIGTAVSPERVTECFNADIQMTIDDCRIIFEHFDGFPEEAQLCLANMCYQLGRPTFSKFKRSIAYANDHQWGDLAEEILDSRWAKQTPNRAKRISDRLSLLEVPA
jgi:lysozyme